MSLVKSVLKFVLSISWLRNLLFLGVSLFYTARVAFFMLVLLVTKFDKKPWLVKDRPVPPKCLRDKQYGEHKYMTVNGIKLHYVDNGNNTKPLMLFVHGFPEFWYSWRYQLKEFSNDYWCIAIDMRGYGDSDKPKGVENYALDIIAEDIHEFIKQLGVKKFYMIAHDFGSLASFHYISKYMDTIEKYVFMDGPPLHIHKINVIKSWEQFKKSWYVFFFKMPFLPEFWIRMFDLRSMMMMGDGKLTDYFTAEDLEAYKYTFSKWDAINRPINFYRNTNEAVPVKPWPTKFAPGLYLMGEKDDYIIRESGNDAQKAYKNLDYKIVPKGNHFVQQSAPEEVNKMIREFIAKK